VAGAPIVLSTLQDRVERLGDQNLGKRPINEPQRFGALDRLAVSGARRLWIFAQH